MNASKLRTETNTPEVEAEVEAAFDASDLGEVHEGVPFFEHGQWWINCGPCGAQWSANDLAGGDETDFAFERVSEGDGYCEEHAHDTEEG